ncbi:13225_t:CDS:2 [Cetraspora pellucida]|uniref:13225_t:CDS:1 n=1 Tax=Cetraspora pellucida TaxID=1433469 RepID=A0ACA9MHN3_9GLOM|nr:13225_t:CDS:2 [Cetraspora pellucida]
MSEFNFEQHRQQFINNVNETQSIFTDSLDLIQHYESVIRNYETIMSTYETHNSYLVNLYNRAYEHFGIFWEIFVENNEDYDHFKREVVNYNAEEVEENGEVNEEQHNETIISRNLNFNDCVASQIIELSDDERSVYSKKSESDGYEEFLEQREHDDYERYLEDKNTQNFLYYMSQRN